MPDDIRNDSYSVTGKLHYKNNIVAVDIKNLPEKNKAFILKNLDFFIMV